MLTTYGRSTGFCVDPIEKKPLNHFYAGTSALSFGTAGCNLGCKFCQNWDITKSRETEILSRHASPETIAEAAHRLCRLRSSTGIAVKLRILDGVITVFAQREVLKTD